MSGDPRVQRIIADLRKSCHLRSNCGCAHAMASPGTGCTANLVCAIIGNHGAPKEAPADGIPPGVGYVFECCMTKGGEVPVITCVTPDDKAGPVIVLSNGVQAMRVRMDRDEAKRLGEFLLRVC